MLVYAGVVKLADTSDLGSDAVRCAGSSPVTRTTYKVRLFGLFSFVLFYSYLGTMWCGAEGAVREYADRQKAAGLPCGFLYYSCISQDMSQRARRYTASLS